MFRKLWSCRVTAQAARKDYLLKEDRKIDRTIEGLLDRIVEAESAIVAKAFEKRIEALQKEKLVIEEKIAGAGRPVKPYNEMYRTALAYLAKPHKLWASGGFTEKRAVLKLTFAQPLIWDRIGAYRTPDLSLPFKALEDFCGQNLSMVPRGGIEPPTRGFSVPCSTD